MRKPSLRSLLFPAALVAAGILYYAVDPRSKFWLIQCPFHRLTGYACPSCGAQRGLHALFNGHLAEAVGYNPFLAVLLPYALFLVVAARIPALQPLYRWLTNRWALGLYFLLALVWWWLRNVYGW